MPVAHQWHPMMKTHAATSNRPEMRKPLENKAFEDGCDQLMSDEESKGRGTRTPTVGRLIDNGLLLHRTALDELEPLLRIYEGCARSWIGEIDEADLVKFGPNSQSTPADISSQLRRRNVVSMSAKDGNCFLRYHGRSGNSTHL